jgi:glycosyltransferase involved in cell wall biosynthesis
VRLQVLRAERVLVISEEIERALRRIGVDSERLVRQNVVGIDTAAFHADPGARAQVREELGVSADAPIVTTIGALHSRKSHDLFLRACREVANADQRARFVVVGEGPKRASLETLAQDLGIANRLSFTGRRRDIPALLAATDVYVKPGVVEGFIGITKQG